jgi:hypothetical protein
MTTAALGYAHTPHSAAQPLRLWFGLSVATTQASKVFMLISPSVIEALKPCDDGWNWYSKNASHITDLKELLRVVDAENPSWCRWLFTRLMTRKQCIEIAVFSAEQVLGEYESRYPNDKRPRDAINAAKAVIKNDTEENRRVARVATYAVAYIDVDTAHAADAAYAAAAAAANAAAYAAANAARAVNFASAAANAAADAAAMRASIINEAVEILNREEK